MNCGNCKYAWHHPDPGPEPESPKKPKGFWAGLFWEEYISWEQVEWGLDNERYINEVICKRFPKSAIKLKDSTCGEFKLKSPKI